MNNNIVLVIIIIVILVGISIGILMWQSQQLAYPAMSPSPMATMSVQPAQSPVNSDSATSINSDFDNTASVDVDTQFKDIDKDMKGL